MFATGNKVLQGRGSSCALLVSASVLPELPPASICGGGRCGVRRGELLQCCCCSLGGQGPAADPVLAVRGRVRPHLGVLQRVALGAGCQEVAAGPCWWLLCVPLHRPRCLGCLEVCGGEKRKRLEGRKEWEAPQRLPPGSYSPCGLPTTLAAELSPQLGLWDELEERRWG